MWRILRSRFAKLRFTAPIAVHTLPDLTQQSRSGRPDASLSWVYMVNYTSTYTYKRGQLKSKIQHTGNWSAAARLPVTCAIAQQYSSAPSTHYAFIPAWKNTALVSKKCYNSSVLIFKNCLIPKLRNLNLRKSRGACTYQGFFNILWHQTS
jgi:hypothetical protein